MVAAGKNLPDLEFQYDANRQRVCKIVKARTPAGALLGQADWKKTYYVRDAQGNVMATYNQLNVTGTQILNIEGQQIYGSSRLGILSEANKRVDVNAETSYKTNFDAGASSFVAIGAGSSVSVDAAQRLKVTVGAGIMFAGANLNLTTLTMGKTYEVSYTIDKSTAPDMKIKAVVLDGATGSAELYTEVPIQGLNSYKFTALSNNNFIKFHNETNANPAYDFYIDNIIVKEVTTGRILGNKSYELSNHLGNVLTVVSDRKLAHTTTPISGIIDYYNSEIISANDYYAFGMAIQGRKFSGSSGYRYGFNGKENDNEVKGQGDQIDFGARMLDPRLGRWMSVDMKAKLYPESSPYNFAANSPIFFVDPDGNIVVPADEASFNAIVDHLNKTVGSELSGLLIQRMRWLDAHPIPTGDVYAQWSKQEQKEYNKQTKAINSAIKKMDNKEVQKLANEYVEAFSSLDQYNVVKIVSETLQVNPDLKGENTSITGTKDVRIRGLGRAMMNFKSLQDIDILFDANKDGKIDPNTEGFRLSLMSQGDKQEQGNIATYSFIRVPTNSNDKTVTSLNNDVIQENISNAIRGKSDVKQDVRKEELQPRK